VRDLTGLASLNDKGFKALTEGKGWKPWMQQELPLPVGKGQGMQAPTQEGIAALPNPYIVIALADQGCHPLTGLASLNMVQIMTRAAIPYGACCPYIISKVRA